MDIEGSVITIDAIGTQTNISEMIIDNKAGYILADKPNNIELFEQIQGRFGQQSPFSVDSVMEKGHSRIETRTYEVITKLDFVDNRIF